MEWDTVIGLEVHIQLLTKSKLFSGASTAYGASPNTQAGVVDIALPGTLPVLNFEAVAMAIRFGLGIHAEINPCSIFDRKNYFYPDLPKGYQITQFFSPIVQNGHLDIALEDGSIKRVEIVRAHLEEDAGKSLHTTVGNTSGIDLNRAGTALIEVVSAPVLYSAKEAVAYLKKLHTLVRYLGISDGNMQEGSFRCDANVSIKPKGSDTLGTRAEIKNVNSFRYVERAINYEVERQIEVLTNGGTVIQETRLYNSAQNTTKTLRTKEDAQDYRYFNDPDLLPVLVSEEWISEINQTLPELPDAKCARFQKEYELSAYDALILTSDMPTAAYFEEAVANSDNAKLVANWIIGELAAYLNKNNLSIEHSPIAPKQIACLVSRIVDETISGKIAKIIFETLCTEGGDVDAIIQDKNLQQVSDPDTLARIIDQVITDNPEQLAEYRSGKDRLFGYFVGQVMKISGGQANPQQLNTLLKEKLG